MTIESFRDYSWNGGDDWGLDHEEAELDFDTTFKFAINGTTFVLTRTGGVDGRAARRRIQTGRWITMR